METNKEQQPKHTHEPWILHNDNQHDQTHKSGWFCGDDKPFGYLLSEEDFNHAAKCVNALEGIEDPETWRMKINNDLSQLQIDLDHAHSVINDLQKYKTACEGINPDNPMAVAEKLGEIIELGEKIFNRLEGQPMDNPLYIRFKELLIEIKS